MFRVNDQVPSSYQFHFSCKYTPIFANDFTFFQEHMGPLFILSEPMFYQLFPAPSVVDKCSGIWKNCYRDNAVRFLFPSSLKGKFSCGRKFPLPSQFCVEEAAKDHFTTEGNTVRKCHILQKSTISQSRKNFQRCMIKC